MRKYFFVTNVVIIFVCILIMVFIFLHSPYFVVCITCLFLKNLSTFLIELEF